MKCPTRPLRLRMIIDKQSAYSWCSKYPLSWMHDLRRWQNLLNNIGHKVTVMALLVWCSYWRCLRGPLFIHTYSVVV